MMTLITGFTCPPTIYFKFITKCDKCYYKVRQLFLLQSAKVCYYKVRQLFYYKVRQVLLQSSTGITKCDNFITKCDSRCVRPSISKCDSLFYYKVRQLLLQSATGRSGKKWVEMEIPLFVKLALWISAQLISRNFAFFRFLGEH